MKKHLKDLREKLGFTQEDFASFIGCKRQTYSNIENGNRQGTIPFFKKVQEKVGLNDSDVWKLTKDE